jgi:hypothetical protein
MAGEEEEEGEMPVSFEPRPLVPISLQVFSEKWVMI